MEPSPCQLQFQPFLFQKIRNTTTTDPLLAVAESDGQRHVFLLGENSWKWRMQSFATHNGFEKFDEFIGKLIFYASSNKRSERLVVQYDLFMKVLAVLSLTPNILIKITSQIPTLYLLFP